MSPGIATMSIMAFIGNWNSYLTPMIILNKNDKFTLPVMMATLRASTDIQSNQGAIYLGSCNISYSNSDRILLLLQVYHQQYFCWKCERVNAYEQRV